MKIQLIELLRHSILGRIFFGYTMNELRQRHSKSLEGQLPNPDQRRQLDSMMRCAFLDIRNTRDIDLSIALADAFHNLPEMVHAPWFSWSYLLIFLIGLEKLYPEIGRNYLAMFDKVVGFDSKQNYTNITS